MAQTTAEHDELLANDSDSSIEMPPEDTGPLRRAYTTQYHLMQIDEVCKVFKVNPDKGLNYNKIEKRRSKYGSNRLTPPQQSKISVIRDEICGVSMCCGLIIPLILCIIAAAMSENNNIWIIILSVILFIATILSCIWSYYGENNLITKYISDPEANASDYKVNVIRQHNAGILISGYWRQIMKETPIQDIIHIIKDYYRM